MFSGPPFFKCPVCLHWRFFGQSQISNLRFEISLLRFEIYWLSRFVQDPGFDLSVLGVFHHFTVQLVTLELRLEMRLTARVILDRDALELVISKLRSLYGQPVLPIPVRVAVQLAGLVLRLH